MKLFILLLLFASASFLTKAQSKSYFDPAQAYNKMLLEQTNTVMQVGNFKVKGTPYLYGGRIMGRLFVHNTREANVFINYNTYAQAIEYNTVLSANEASLQASGTVDSFIILKNDDLQITDNLQFINGKHLYDDKEGYYQTLFKGEQFSLYKKYKSELAIVSTNYIQADLRQFDLSYEYFYTDSASNKLKKLKPNTGFLKKEFKGKMDIDTVINNDDLSYAQEKALTKLFAALNK